VKDGTGLNSTPLLWPNPMRQTLVGKLLSESGFLGQSEDKFKWSWASGTLAFCSATTTTTTRNVKTDMSAPPAITTYIVEVPKDDPRRTIHGFSPYSPSPVSPDAAREALAAKDQDLAAIQIAHY